MIPPVHTVLSGKLRVLSVLGEGGMGTVLLAEHLGLGVRVAVKVLGDRDRRPETTQRLLREGRAAGLLRSDNVARVMDVGTLDDGSPYLVMEHVEGHTVAELSRRRGPLPIEEAVDWVLQATEALAEAHPRGIVHRDLKPSNLMVTTRTDGSLLIKVMDFGVARTASWEVDGGLTGSMALLGSPRYMSPEQIRDAREVDARTDIWGLGVVLYELVTASVPFDAHTTPGVLAQIAADPAPDPRKARSDLPDGLADVILACLEKDRARRPRDASALASMLAPFASDEGRQSAARVPKIAARVTAPLDRTMPAFDGADTARDLDPVASGQGGATVDSAPTVGSVAVSTRATSTKETVRGASSRAPWAALLLVAVAVPAGIFWSQRRVAAPTRDAQTPPPPSAAVAPPPAAVPVASTTASAAAPAAETSAATPAPPPRPRVVAKPRAQPAANDDDLGPRN